MPTTYSRHNNTPFTPCHTALTPPADAPASLMPCEQTFTLRVCSIDLDCVVFVYTRWVRVVTVWPRGGRYKFGQ